MSDTTATIDPYRHDPDKPLTTSRQARQALKAMGIHHRPYRARQDGAQVRITCHPEEAVKGHTLASTADTLLNELVLALQNKLTVGHRLTGTPVVDVRTNLTTSVIVTWDYQEPDLTKVVADEEKADREEWTEYVVSGRFRAAMDAMRPRNCPEFPDVPIVALDPRTIAQLKLAAEAAIDLTEGLGFHHPCELRLNPDYLTKVARRIDDHGHIKRAEHMSYLGDAYIDIAHLLRLLAQALPGHTPGPVEADLIATATWTDIRTRVGSHFSDTERADEVYPRLRQRLTALALQVPAARKTR